MPDDFDPQFPALPDNVAKEAKFQAYPAQIQAFADIARLVNDVRKAASLDDYRSLQQRLGKHLARVEAEVGKAKDLQSHAEKRLRKLRQRRTPATPTELATQEAAQEQAILDREQYLRLAREYRTVGDAIAWQLYDFQTQAIVALGANQGPGIIGTKAGAAEEAAQVESLWREQGAFALRHDYTNCLRIWDLSVFTLDQANARVKAEILEVKSSGRSVPAKQKNQGRRVSEFVKHKVTTAPNGTLLIHRRLASQSPDGPRQNNFPLIQRAIEEAAETGLGYAHNAYFAVVALNLLHPATRQPDEATRSRLEQLRDIPVDIMRTPCQDYLTAHSHQKVNTPLFGAPFSIYPLTSDHCAALTTGFLRVAFHLNTCALIDAFRANGFEGQFIPALTNPAHLEPLTAKGDQFLLQRMSHTIRLSTHAIEQMLFEGLSVDELVDAIRTDYEATRRGNKVLIPRIVGPYPRTTTFLTTFMGQEDMWHASRTMILADDELP
jgi:hypothetical protein